MKDDDKEVKVEPKVVAKPRGVALSPEQITSRERAHALKVQRFLGGR